MTNKNEIIIIEHNGLFYLADADQKDNRWSEPYATKAEAQAAIDRLKRRKNASA